MFTTIITDCYEANETGRQITRFNSLNLGPTSLVGIGSDFSADATLEGAANLIDMIDASEGKEGILVLNVAPRGNKKDGENGNPFSYFFYKKSLIISTTKDQCLSLLPKFNITKEVNLMELKDVLSFAKDKNLIDKEMEEYITHTQFRSFDFVPRIAEWLINGMNIPSTPFKIRSSEISDSVWCIDAFGNAKTTIISNDKGLSPGQKVNTNYGTLKFYHRLKDVPFSETAIYTGSSGFGDKRFLEFTVQGIPGSVSKKLGLKLGDKIEIK